MMVVAVWMMIFTLEDTGSGAGIHWGMWAGMPVPV